MSTSPEARWYQDAIIYEVHVRAFRDSNGDGVGDFKGLISKLDYVKDLGVTALWLLPFYPSPLRDDGYDIADYRSINPAYGTMRDFRRFLAEAHARDLKVITELVINHTSDQHPWFTKARNAPPGSVERDFYVWSDTPDRYREARIIFQDTETSNWTWDPVAGAYYWHRFFSHQPDLNFENPAVHEAIFGVLDFWLDMGVDGLRLDAVPYLYEEEGTMCENLPRTHEFLKELRGRMDRRYDDRLFIAEANQWPEDAVAYFGDGDECHMCFHFPLMPRLFMGLRMENRFPIIDILEQTPEIPESAAWAIFLRNHDELTLEMVTDEERDYMYSAYARDPRMKVNVGIRRRLAPLLDDNRREMELLNGLLLSLPGTPVIYYGDEIGMGDNIYLGDRNGVRTPMQWSGDRNAGFSEANPQSLYLPVITDPQYHYESTNVEVQRENPNSLWWWMKRAIAVRKSLPELSRGEFGIVPSDNTKVFSFVRRLDEGAVLVVANLSRHPQPVALNLEGFEGIHPVEVMGRSRFPVVDGDPYPLTVGAHDVIWLSLRPEEAAAVPGRPTLTLRGDDLEALWRSRSQLERVLVADISHRRWFRSKGQTVSGGELLDLVSMPDSGVKLAFLEVSYVEAEPETYVIPLAVAVGAEARDLEEDRPRVGIADISGPGEPGLLYDAAGDPDLVLELGRLAAGRRKVRGGQVSLRPAAVSGPADLRHLTDGTPVRVADGEQSNSSAFIDDRYIMKLFRKLEPGPNPEVEVGRFLTEDRGFPHSPAALGLVVADVPGGEAALAFFQDFVVAEQLLFDHTFDGAVLALEQMLASPPTVTPRGGHPLDFVEADIDLAAEILGAHVVEASLLGRRTGEMHLALGSKAGDPVFDPEPMSTLQQRALYQSIRSTVRTGISALRKHASRIGPEQRDLIAHVLESEEALLEIARRVTREPIDCQRIRIHGDYHLGQVLFTGNDFHIIDFEGEPQRPLTQRRLKRVGLRDVAGMVRSYHYAMFMALRQVTEAGVAEETHESLRRWATFFYGCLSREFIEGYRQATSGSPIVPSDAGQFRLLLDAFLVEKAAYELGYEVNNRPDWVGIPLQGIVSVLA